MKKLLAIILAAFMLVSVSACGKKDDSPEKAGAGKDKDDKVSSEKQDHDEGPVAELTWEISADGVLTVNGKGRMPEYYNETDMLIDRPWEKDTDKISSVVIGEGITSVSSRAFMFCRNMVSVSIPDSVTSVGDDAFYCCYDLAEITLPSSVKRIGAFAFKGCAALPQIGFRGTMSQWSKISLGEEAVPVPKAVCTDGEVRLAAEVPDSETSQQVN